MATVTDDPLELISIDPTICHSHPCIKGTRVMVTVVLDALAAGLDTSEIVLHYPTLTVDGVRAAVAYGAWLAEQESDRSRRAREAEARREHHRRSEGHCGIAFCYT